VVDCGGGGNVVTPVIDGMVLERSQRRNGRGGEYVGEVIANRIKDKIGRDVEVGGRVKDGKEGEIGRDIWIQDLATDFKKSHGYMAQFGKLDLREVKSLIPEGSVYELPDGTRIDVNDSPEIFIAPSEIHYKSEEVRGEQAKRGRREPTSKVLMC